jgi:hypothetical protein
VRYRTSATPLVDYHIDQRRRTEGKPVMSAKIVFAAAIFAVTMGLLAIPQVTQADPFDTAYAVSAAD